MDPKTFECEMKRILKKYGEKLNLEIDWEIVSSDADVVSDFGIDHDGNLVIYKNSFPIKIEDITSIRYRWAPINDDRGDCFIRFDFGSDYLDINYSEDGMTGECEIKIGNKYKTYFNHREMIEYIKKERNE